MKTNRRNFNKIILASIGGLLAGVQLASSYGYSRDGRAPAGVADAGGDKHVCKGMNACKGQGGCKTGDAGCAGKNSCKGHGGCATSAKHECSGKNACKGQGGCKSGDHGCAGKNSCKGKGGCGVPVDESHMS